MCVKERERECVCVCVCMCGVCESLSLCVVWRVNVYVRACV